MKSRSPTKTCMCPFMFLLDIQPSPAPPCRPAFVNADSIEIHYSTVSSVTASLSSYFLHLHTIMEHPTSLQDGLLLLSFLGLPKSLHIFFIHSCTHGLWSCLFITRCYFNRLDFVLCFFCFARLFPPSHF